MTIEEYQKAKGQFLYWRALTFLLMFSCMIWVALWGYTTILTDVLNLSMRFIVGLFAMLFIGILLTFLIAIIFLSKARAIKKQLPKPEGEIEE